MIDLSLTYSVAAGYSSASQIARVVTELWAHTNLYCPECGQHRLVRYTNNTPVADFYCSACQSDFELKSRKGPFGPKIIAGSYAAMIERTGKPSSPHFILLQHDGDVVIEVSIIPNFYFVPGNQYCTSPGRREGLLCSRLDCITTIHCPGGLAESVSGERSAGTIWRELAF
jgi:type II restriction enzyme